MPSKTWGNSYTLEDHIIVGDTDEIPSGQFAYVFNQSQQASVEMLRTEWQQFLAGNITELKNNIETQIPNSEVLSLTFHWDNAEDFDYWETTPYPHTIPYTRVYGFKVEALVKNTGGAAMTGAEIVLIILAIAFFAVVITFLALGIWLIWQVMNAAANLGPLGTIGVGLIIIVLIGIGLVLLFGVSFSGKGKGKSFRVGK